MAASLQPHIQSSLSMKNYMEKVVQVKMMKENVAALHMKAKGLKKEMVTAEVDLERAKRDLLKVL